MIFWNILSFTNSHFLPDKFGTIQQPKFLHILTYIKDEEGLISFLRQTINISLPLMQLLYAMSRSLVIVYPHFIPKFGSRKASALAIMATIFISATCSFHIFYDGEFQVESFPAYLADMEEPDGKTANFVVMVVVSLTVFVCFSLLTKGMNDILEGSISFLKSMQGSSYEKRSVSYKKIIMMNNFLLILSLCSVTISTALTLSKGIVYFIATGTIFHTSHSSLNHLVVLIPALLMFLSSLEICLFPLIFLIYIPSICQSWKFVFEKVTSSLRNLF